MFDKNSHSLVYGKHVDFVQRMLDFDFLSGRDPSVRGIIDPNSLRKSFAKIFFGEKEILVPIYPSIARVPHDAGVDTLINFASFRSASAVTWEALESARFANIVIIAEGISEREIREIIHANDTKFHIRIIGPATAGALAGGAMRLGNNG
jgi:ATP-citrate lyase alpha-subunit